MRPSPRCISFFLFAALLAGPDRLLAQTSGSISGVVVDPTGATIGGASITVKNVVSGLSRTVLTDTAGHFLLPNLPRNTYGVTVSAPGFANFSQSVDALSSVTVNLPVKLALASGSGVTIDVEAGPDLASQSSFSTDIERSAIEKLPLESQSSGLSSIVTLSSPGVAADSNGQIHGLGDHASNTFAIDGQTISDQQSKVFSNQLPSNAVQSIQVIAGAPPAEYGGKTSMVIEVTTRSGQGSKTPTGSVSASYGSFGSVTGSVDLSYGGDKWGNFIEVDGLNTGRFLDPPEFRVFHDKGNELNLFDRIDRQLNEKDSVRLNLNLSRSWFQTPNSYDNLNVVNVASGGASVNPVLANAGNADQRSKILTFNVAPTYTRAVSPYAVFNFGVWARRDGYDYYPSRNALADKSAPNLQNQSIAQDRSLLNVAARTDYSYARGRNNVKLGATYTQTFLNENDTLGLVSNTFNAPCVDGNGNPVNGYSSPGQCYVGGFFPNPAFLPVLLPYDLTRGGTEANFRGHADIKELGLYIQDQIKAGNWLFNLGARFDRYNGLATAFQAQPRLGVSYTIKQTGTVLRTSYARTLESPFNENLVLSSRGCGSAVLAPLLNCTPGVSTTLQPGFRNEFHAGLQQNVTKHLVFSGDYIWKYTHNAFDFSVLGNTPITFPIDWHNSKIPGFALRADVPNVRGFSAFVVMSSVSARFFPPQVAGAGATVAQGSQYPFRIDHDEKFNQTTHAQYTIPGKRGPWVGFNWRYDSGLTAASAPCYNAVGANSGCGVNSILIGGQPGINLSGYSFDEQAEAGLACGGVKATPYSGFGQCLASQLTSSLLSIPKPNTENDDRNPPRIKQRDLFDLSLGEDNLFGGKEKKWSLQLTAVNVTNKLALYNYLSTFSGTHFVTPRALNAEMAFHF
jgi:hypothetical protein